MLRHNIAHSAPTGAGYSPAPLFRLLRSGRLPLLLRRHWRVIDAVRLLAVEAEPIVLGDRIPMQALPVSKLICHE